MTAVETGERSADRRVREKSGVAANNTPTGWAALRSLVARERVEAARAALADCRLCAHRCGVNRLVGELGLCRAGAETRFFSAQMEVGDELELIPTFAIALSGCDLRCDFCVTGRESWNPRAGTVLTQTFQTRMGSARGPRAESGGPPDCSSIRSVSTAAATARQTVANQPESQRGKDFGGPPKSTRQRRVLPAVCRPGANGTPSRDQEKFGLTPEGLVERAQAALGHGARTVMILGGEPTIHLPTVLELVAALPDSAKLVWKTNAHGSAQARELLDGLFDVWLADYKFGNDTCSQKLAKVPDYTRVVRENLFWASKRSELIVRHLLMPGHLECCWRPVAEWLAAELPGVKVSLRSGFWPGWKAARHPELRRTVSAREGDQALQVANECNLNLVR